jgi:hypothetical protein
MGVRWPRLGVARVDGGTLRSREQPGSSPGGSLALPDSPACELSPDYEEGCDSDQEEEEDGPFYYVCFLSKGKDG